MFADEIIPKGVPVAHYAGFVSLLLAFCSFFPPTVNVQQVNENHSFEILGDDPGV